jgi:phosphate uptake regulator
MKRKVQLTGTSTFAISLPKDWAVKHGISAGRELTLEETAEGALLVKTTEAEAAQKETAVRVSDYRDVQELMRTIFSRYLAGYDIIRVVSAEPITAEVHDAALSVLDSTIGLEITEESEKEMVLQNFFSHTGFSIRKMTKRAEMIAYDMQKTAFNAVLKNDEALAQAAEDRDAEVNKIYFLVRRELELASRDSALMRDLGLESRDSMTHLILIRNIEHIADAARRIGRNLGIAPKDLADDRFVKEVEKANWESMELTRTAVDAFFSRDVARAHTIIKRCHALKAEIDVMRKEMFGRILRQKEVEMLSNMRSLAVLIQTIIDHTAEIAELVVDREALGDGEHGER